MIATVAASSLAGGAAMNAPAASHAVPRLLGGAHGVRKPRSYCPANHTCFKQARWSAWSTKRAVARATARTQYPGGPAVSGRITFRFSSPRHVCGGWYFTRARWRYRADEQYTEASVMAPACFWTGA
jgi:hypothetical protein